MTFEEWKLKLDLSKWKTKYQDKGRNAVKLNLSRLLTFDEYLFKAYEAGMTSHDQIGRGTDKYQLSRINDEGDYTVESCRFILTSDNHKEKDFSYLKNPSESWKENILKSNTNNTWSQGEKNGRAKLNSIQVREIFLSNLDNYTLSKLYNIGIDAIRNIKSRFRWKSVTEDLVNV